MRLGLIFIMVTTALLVWLVNPAQQSSQANLTQQCDAVMHNLESKQGSACDAPSEQVTWHSWATGQSRSTQFHFFDLLELLFSDSKATKAESANRFNNTSI